MFQSIVNRAQRSVDTLISKYVTRVAVAVPFVVALGFGTAAASVALTEMYGSLVAHAVLAAGFGLVGTVAAAAIAVGGGQPVTTTADESPEQLAVANTDETNATSSSFDPEMLVTAMGAIGPVAVPTLIRLLVRNLPLVLGVLVLAYLLFTEVKTTSVSTASQAE